MLGVPPDKWKLAHDRSPEGDSLVDGLTTVFVNGQPVEMVPRRAPFEADATAAARSGENVVAVRADNRKIGELFLGGILRPVVLVERK